MIQEKIDEIIDKYYNEDEEYYSKYRYEERDDSEVEFDMQVEIEEYLKSINAVYGIDFTDGFDSCSYSNDFLAVAWNEDGEINVKTVLLENY